MVSPGTSLPAFTLSEANGSFWLKSRSGVAYSAWPAYSRLAIVSKVSPVWIATRRSSETPTRGGVTAGAGMGIVTGAGGGMGVRSSPLTVRTPLTAGGVTTGAFGVQWLWPSSGTVADGRGGSAGVGGATTGGVTTGRAIVGGVITGGDTIGGVTIGGLTTGGVMTGGATSVGGLISGDGFTSVGGSGTGNGFTSVGGMGTGNGLTSVGGSGKGFTSVGGSGAVGGVGTSIDGGGAATSRGSGLTSGRGRLFFRRPVKAGVFAFGR